MQLEHIWQPLELDLYLSNYIYVCVCVCLFVFVYTVLYMHMALHFLFGVLKAVEATVGLCFYVIAHSAGIRDLAGMQAFCDLCDSVAIQILLGSLLLSSVFQGQDTGLTLTMRM